MTFAIAPSGRSDCRGGAGHQRYVPVVSGPSALGSFSYEVTDTKLKRRPTPKHVLQLVVYSDLLAEIQGVEPQFAHVELGNGKRESLRLSDFSAYARAARRRLEQFVEAPKPTRPVPCRTAVCAAGATTALSSGRPRTASSPWPTSARAR